MVVSAAAMEVVQSLEMRWFFPDDDARAAELRDWFGAVSVEGGDRVDRYYIDPHRPDFSLKERTEQGKASKLELKYCVGVLGQTRLVADVVGDLERWTKLSLEAQESLATKPGIISISKSRRIRKLRYSGAGVDEIAASERPDAGCNVELTHIEATRGNERAVATTFGFEAFGPESDVLDALQGAARRIFAERPGLSLEASTSRSYVSWLSTLPHASKRRG